MTDKLTHTPGPRYVEYAINKARAAISKAKEG